MVKAADIYRFLFGHTHVATFKILDFTLIGTSLKITCHTWCSTWRKCRRFRWNLKQPLLDSAKFFVSKTISIFPIFWRNCCRPRDTYHSFPETFNDTSKPTCRAINVIVNKADNISARTTQTFISEF